MQHLISSATLLLLISSTHGKTSGQLCRGTAARANDGNWYCSEVQAITYRNISQPGEYNRTTQIDPKTGLCQHESISYPGSGPLTPLFGELSMHLRGPMTVSQIAVYTLANTISNNPRRDIKTHEDNQEPPEVGREVHKITQSFSEQTASVIQVKSEAQRPPLLDLYDQSPRNRTLRGLSDSKCKCTASTTTLTTTVFVTSTKCANSRTTCLLPGTTTAPIVSSDAPCPCATQIPTPDSAFSSPTTVDIYSTNAAGGSPQPPGQSRQSYIPSKWYNSRWPDYHLRSKPPPTSSKDLESRNWELYTPSEIPYAPSTHYYKRTSIHQTPSDRHSTRDANFAQPSTMVVMDKRSASTQTSDEVTAAAAAWKRVAYYTSSAPAKATGIAFLANRGDDRQSGTFDYSFGNSLSYVSRDGSQVAPQNMPFDGVLKTSEIEIAAFTDTICDGSCEYYRPKSTAYHGWDGEDKAFFIEFQMDHLDNIGSDQGMLSDAPAWWFLNAAIPRILQYGSDRNNIPCSCWSTGCGEFDAFEVLGRGEERAKSTLHRQGNIEGGDSNYFKRPVGRTMKFAVVFHHFNITAAVLPDEFDFSQTLTEDVVGRIIAYDPDSTTHSLFAIGD